MNFELATLGQLYEITCHDQQCAAQYKFAALAELQKRKRMEAKRAQGTTKTNYREKRHYARG